MVNFWKLVNKVLKDADVIIEVIDSKLIKETRNTELEEKVKESGKALVYVLNKADLVDKKYLEEQEKEFDGPCIFVSAKKKLGTTLLKKKLLAIAKGEKIRVGIVGYPNTGKSSIINALKGSSSAPTSSFSGYTKAIQHIRIAKNLLLIDCPGVIPYGDKKSKDETDLAFIGAKNPQEVKDPDIVAMKIIKFVLEANPKALTKLYGIEPEEDPYDTLEAIAIKKKRLKKGGVPDINTMSRLIIKDWQDGKLV